MPRLKITQKAIQDLEEALTRVIGTEAKQNKAHDVLAMANTLSRAPYLGSPSPIYGVRELTMHEVQRVVAYRFEAGELQILRFIPDNTDRPG